MRWLPDWLSILSLFLVVSFAGCVTQSVEPDSHQSALGLGIVEGTKGYQQVQKDLLVQDGDLTRVRGQVHAIEGGAYVVHTGEHVVIRVPLDENTQIDRPAHKGDWIDAYLHESGGAIFIQNVDDQIVLD